MTHRMTHRAFTPMLVARTPLIAAVAASILVMAGCGGGDDPVAATGRTDGVQPLALPGPLAVGCSNVAQDFTRVPSGDDAEGYWEGVPAVSGTPRQLADLLVDPADALSVSVTTPAVSDLFGNFAGRTLAYSLLVCYPTHADNPRSDYALATGQAVPRMQTGAQPPLFADAAARYPVLVFSHGLRASPLDEEHLKVLTWLASHGYVVAAPFHADPRVADLAIDSFGDAVSLIANLDDVIAMQALRPLALSAALDLLFTNPQWRDHLDAGQVGGFGASLGGEALLLMGGAALTTTPGLASRAVGADSRLKAAVGYVPYFGARILPSFGRDQEGLDGVTLPYLAIGGTADDIAPLDVMQQGVERMQGRAALVELVGLQHELDANSAPDTLTWALTFLDAQVRGDATAQQRLRTMGSVAGGGDDRLVIAADTALAP